MSITPPEAGQAAAVAFLSDPAHWQPPVDRVERIETHGAIVFLGGDLALKMKRAVGFGWMDFSTLAKRDAATAAEVTLNRRTAPGLYVGQRWITREADGRLALDGVGERVEPLVAMRRFPDADLLDRVAAEGRLTVALAERLADAVAAFHAAAAPIPAAGGAAMHRDVVETARASLAAHGGFLNPAMVDALYRGLLAALDRIGPLLEMRRGQGLVRHCHGDLHLRNIVLQDGVPVPFDCIEFNPAFAEIDVFYDLAFLVMDLVHRGLRAIAGIVLSRYLAGTGDMAGLALLPFFLSTRAAIRAHVAAIAAGSVDDPAAAAAQRREAAGYLDRAIAFLAPGRPRLLAVGGLSGSGKTTFARAVAPRLDVPPGAVVLRSDEIRKCLAGRRPDEALGPEAYTPGSAAAVYAALRDRAAAALAAGRAVVVDAVHAREEERVAIERVAADAGLRFDGVWLEAPTPLMAQRIERRIDDASDATVAVLDRQRGFDLGVMRWRPVATDRPMPEVVADLAAPLALDPG